MFASDNKKSTFATVCPKCAAASPFFGAVSYEPREACEKCGSPVMETGVSGELFHKFNTYDTEKSTDTLAAAWAFRISRKAI